MISAVEQCFDLRHPILLLACSVSLPASRTFPQYVAPCLFLNQICSFYFPKCSLEHFPRSSSSLGTSFRDFECWALVVRTILMLKLIVSGNLVSLNASERLILRTFFMDYLNFSFYSEMCFQRCNLFRWHLEKSKQLQLPVATVPFICKYWIRWKQKQLNLLFFVLYIHQISFTMKITECWLLNTTNVSTYLCMDPLYFSARSVLWILFGIYCYDHLTLAKCIQKFPVSKRPREFAFMCSNRMERVSIL